MRHYYFAFICLFGLPVHAQSVTIQLSPGKGFELKQEVLFRTRIPLEQSCPGDTMHELTFWGAAAADAIANITLGTQLKKQPMLPRILLGIVSWFGGVAGLIAGYTKIVPHIAQLEELFKRLALLQDKKNLATVVQSYDYVTVQDTQTRAALYAFAQRSFSNKAAARAAAKRFLHQQLTTLAKRLYWLRLAALCLGGGIVGQTLTGYCAFGST